jgi:hypothetical protein
MTEEKQTNSVKTLKEILEVEKPRRILSVSASLYSQDVKPNTWFLPELEFQEGKPGYIWPPSDFQRRENELCESQGIEVVHTNLDEIQKLDGVISDTAFGKKVRDLMNEEFGLGLFYPTCLCCGESPLRYIKAAEKVLSRDKVYVVAPWSSEEGGSLLDGRLSEVRNLLTIIDRNYMRYEPLGFDINKRLITI